jgi:hypothetical protein
MVDPDGIRISDGFSGADCRRFLAIDFLLNAAMLSDNEDSFCQSFFPFDFDIFQSIKDKVFHQPVFVDNPATPTFYAKSVPLYYAEKGGLVDNAKPTPLHKQERPFTVDMSGDLRHR